MIEPSNFQLLLRQFGGPLAGVEVKHKTEADALFRPHVVDITGVANIHGRPVIFETEDFDLRAINGTEDVLQFAGRLLESFSRAAAAPDFKPAPTH